MLRKLLGILQILLAFSFLLMVLNVMFYYGFRPTTIHSNTDPTNPFGLTVPLIWAIHLPIGFLAGLGFSKKHYFLSGSMGLLSAALITEIAILYFGWREDLMAVELLLPLILGILPAVKLFEFLKRRMYPGEKG